MKKIVFAFTIFAVVVIAVSMAVAQQAGGQGKGKGDSTANAQGRIRQGVNLLMMFDANKDGQIAQQEWIAVFKQIDSDGDGIITQEEITQHRDEVRQGAGKNVFQRFDKDGDGSISRDEFPGRDEKFKTLDANSDGKITPEEFTSVMTQQNQEIKKERIKNKMKIHKMEGSQD